MTEALPPPLLPPYVWLGGFPYTQLHGDLLFTSETWICASDAARVAYLKLYWEAFKSHPGGSLPSDDRMLAELAGYGTWPGAVRAWRRIKKTVLAEWVLCSDGRWWHPFLAGRVAAAWNRMQEDRWEAEKARITRAHQRACKAARALDQAQPDAPKMPPQPSFVEVREVVLSGGVAATEGDISAPVATTEGVVAATEGDCRGSVATTEGVVAATEGDCRGDLALNKRDKRERKRVGRLALDPQEAATAADDAATADPAEALIELFDAAMVRHWGAVSSRQGPDGSDLSMATDWLLAGVDADLLAKVCDAQFRRMVARRVAPPFSLRGLDEDVRRAVAAARAKPPGAPADHPLAMPEGFPVAVAALVGRLGRQRFASWVSPLVAVDDGTRVTVRAPTLYHRDYVATHLAHDLGPLFGCRRIDFETGGAA